MPEPPETDVAKIRKYRNGKGPARLRHQARVEAAVRWSLYWADRNGGWHRYDDLDPGPVDGALNEIEADPTCIFWG